MPKARESNLFTGDIPSFAAVSFRSAALFIVLFQFRLLAGELADTSVFLANLVFAFAVPWLLRKSRRVSLPQSLSVVILVPWMSRFFIALAGCFSGPDVFGPDVSGAASVFADSLLLGLDRNNFVALVPYYWAVLTNCFAYRSRLFLRADIIAQNVLVLVLFSVTKTSNIEIYRLPVYKLCVFGAAIFLQILALIFSFEPLYRLRFRERLAGSFVMFALVAAGGILLLRPLQEQEVNQGGGLLRPNIFRFDFSRFLRLESEISLSDDLVLIVKKDPKDDHYLLRRYVLSGYDTKRGFYLDGKLDEKVHPSRLPEHRQEIQHEKTLSSGLTAQEYYIVNFDASSFIALNQPVEVTPFQNWDVSSFNSAYAVTSLVSTALPFELEEAAGDVFRENTPENGKPDPAVLGLSDEEYAHYTSYGGDERIARYAGEMTRGIDTYREKIFAVYETLKYGEYRYSLKPGIAASGDQLGHFLFDVKKGYCSYFAFSMTLLLRSLGIPARVAVGFFFDSALGAFDYYPVRSDMAHAWVEVLFPGCGWIEFDPTTSFMAEGEEFRLSAGVPEELFEKLMREILENRSRLVAKEKTLNDEAGTELARGVRRVFRRVWPFLLALLFGAAAVFVRLGLYFAYTAARSFRKKALYLWLHAERRLRLAGVKRSGGEAAGAWAIRLDEAFGLYGLYEHYAAARFAPDYGEAELERCRADYRLFSRRYARQTGFSRRILAWVFPLALFFLPASFPRNAAKDAPAGSRGRSGSALGLILLVIFAPLVLVRTQAQDGPDSPDSLYSEALSAKDAENWERALEKLTLGGKLYPGDFRFPWTLGSLYYSRNLFALAWDEFKKAENLDGQNTELIYQLSRTAGHLNRDSESADYLEKLLVLEPDNLQAVEDLAWMLFKLHRLSEGETLLLEAEEKYGPEPGLSMTLGTIYLDMFRYEDGKKHYLEAIAASGSAVFTAVAYYNLSILESRYYKFADAFEAAASSLRAFDRASGRLARGELYLRRLDFSRALGEYQEASAKDNSPLSRLNLAQAYQMAGRLEEARVYAEDVLASGDLSWMINYGTSVSRYKRDIHEVLFQTYKGLAFTEGKLPRPAGREWAKGKLKALAYYFRAEVHKLLYQKYSLAAAEAYARQGQKLDALSNYYAAFKVYPRRGRNYLTAAREFETALIPGSEADYDLEESVLLKDPLRAEAVLERLDPVWERDLIARAYTVMGCFGGERAAKAAAERLFFLNRGALRQCGIKLPVKLDLEPDILRGMRRNTLTGALKKAGIDPRPSHEECRYTLRLAVRDGDFSWELYDSGRGTVMARNRTPAGKLSGKDLYALAGNMGDTLFVSLPGENPPR